MGMRVTNAQLMNLVSFNMQRTLSRYLDLQTEISTGRRINKPSDDPLGTLRDMDYREKLHKIEQHQLNVSTATNWQRNYDTLLSDAKNLVTNANELAISMSNDSYDASARAASAQEVSAIFARLVNLANTEEGSKSVFSGYRTGAAAFTGSPAGVVYHGDTGSFELEVQDGLSMQVNQIGSEVFLAQLSTLGGDADLQVAVTATTLLSDLHGGEGVDLTDGATPGTITITDHNLGLTSTIDFNAGPAVVTVQDVLDRLNSQLALDGITDITAQLGPSGNHIMFEANPSGLVTTGTKLEVLHQGAGVDMNPGRILLTDGVNPDIEIDLSGSTDLNDIITKFNAQAPALVTMQIDPAGNKGLQIIDANAVPLGLSVEEAGLTEATAMQLGIMGEIGVSMIGQDLDPSINMEVAETTGTTAADLGILAEFTASYFGGDLNPNLIVTDSLSILNNGAGFELGEIVIAQGLISRTIDLGSPSILTVQDMLDAINFSGLDVTASINDAGSGIQIVNNDTSMSLTIEDAQAGGALTKNLGLYGSSDVMGSMLVLTRAMENNDADGIRQLVGNMEDSIDHLLTMRARVGARWGQLEQISATNQENDLRYVSLLAETEDADLTKLITKLATYENNYQVSLAAAARIIQPTLMDFLR